MIRLFDILIAIAGLVLLAPFLVFCYLLVRCELTSPLFFQKRVGRHRVEFTLVKFRTMLPETENLATHLVNPEAITRFGRILRTTKIDELPQLWNVLCGHMSLVGPRPCLPTQHEVIRERERLKIFDTRPGITGLAQLCDIDMSQPKTLAMADAKMREDFCIKHYFLFIFWTLSKKKKTLIV